jgi:hypothetical protein
MSRSAYVILSCILSSVLLVGEAQDSFGASPLSQQSIGDLEGSIEATESVPKDEGSAGDDSAVDDSANGATAKPNEPMKEEPQLDQPGRGTTLSNRLLLTGTLVVVLLGQLAVLFGYLRINHATRGFYSGRLQSFSAVASVAVIAAGYLFYVTWKI